jgi:hypothetical protein
MVEEHLAEVRVAHRVADGTHVDAGGAHVEQEVGDALALGRGRVGAGQEQAPVGVAGAAGPQLLTVDHIAVAVPAGCRTQAGQVRAGLWLGEPLAPDLAVEDGRQVPPPLLVGARAEQRRGRMVDRHERQHQPGRVVGGQLLVQHHLLGDRHAPAPLGRPVGYGPTCVPQFPEPRLLEGDEAVLAHAGLRLPPARGDVAPAPGPHLVPELARVVGSH